MLHSIYMRLHRFFIGGQIESRKEISLQDTELFHQLKNVFRYNVGSQIIIFDGSGFEYLANIVSFARGEIALSIMKKEKSFMPEREVWFFQSLIKKDNFEWVLQKGTELGVSCFVPVISERAEKKKFNE